MTRKTYSAAQVSTILAENSSEDEEEPRSGSLELSGPTPNADYSTMLSGEELSKTKVAFRRRQSLRKENRATKTKTVDNDACQAEPFASSSPLQNERRRRRSSRSFLGRTVGDDRDVESLEEEWQGSSVRKSLKADFDRSLASEKSEKKKHRKSPSPQDDDLMIEHPGVDADADVTVHNRTDDSVVGPVDDGENTANEDVCMSQKQVEEVLQHLEDPWKAEKHLLMTMYRKYFSQWHFTLRMDMNILINGVGSKRDLLEEFRVAELKAVPTLVIDGFEKDCSIETVLKNFCEVVIEADEIPKDISDVFSIVREYVCQNYTHFYIILHNIDGAGLRTLSAQKILSEMAAIPQVHMIASIDHPNLPLLWSQTELSRFQWVHYHTSTFARYTEFPIPNLSASSKNGESASLASLQQVFEGLTANAQSIYCAIAKHQVEPDHDDDTAVDPGLGMPYNTLYRTSRAELWVSSDSGLRKQLVEFYDHDLLKKKRGPDGQEYLRIPLGVDALKTFLTWTDK